MRHPANTNVQLREAAASIQTTTVGTALSQDGHMYGDIPPQTRHIYSEPSATARHKLAQNHVYHPANTNVQLREAVVSVQTTTAGTALSQAGHIYGEVRTGACHKHSRTSNK